MPPIRFHLPALFLVLVVGWFPAEGADFEFFEKRIRPVLVAECYKCHSGAKAKGGLRLDFRDGLLKGGEKAAIIPGDPEGSRLLKTLQHDLPDLKMPKDGARLDSAIIADFREWIAAGAPDPRDEASVAAQPVSWESTMAFRKQWWSFQPIAEAEIPVAMNNWSSHPVDRFLLDGMKEKGLAPARPAGKGQVIRRLYFALTGLPPTTGQMREAMNKSHAALVDELLATDHFGERWARHWMDWFRYAESHGSEGDPKIPYVHRYRDYLIRALNSDVPYDQLVREHLAGDLLKKPRINADLGLNESAIGTAHYRLVQHGFQPTEPMMEMVRFVDDQIDVVSKALLGLTVSCARCHNHKFDPISQKDYYALFGIMRSSMPGIVTVDAPGRAELNRERLNELKTEIRGTIADEWIAFADRVPGLLLGGDESVGDEFPQTWQRALKSATSGNRGNPFIVWNSLVNKSGPEFLNAWQGLVAEQGTGADDYEAAMKATFRKGWNPSTIQTDWFKNGAAWQDGSARAGGFFINPSGSTVVAGVYPRGMFSHRGSSKHGGVLTSPKFRLTGDSISVRLMGNDSPQARLVVGNYPVARGGIYGMRSQPRHEKFVWYRWDTRYWEGEEAHIEVATHDDLMLFGDVYRGEKKPNRKDGRSYIGISDVVFNELGQEQPKEKFGEVYEVLRGNPPEDAGALAGHYREVLKRAVIAWKTRNMDDHQAVFVNFLLQAKLLPNSPDTLGKANELLTEYRSLEAEIPVSTRSSGVLETVGFNQPLLDRGDYRRPNEPVERRFLEVFQGMNYPEGGSGRLELAEDVLRPDNPLVPRVLVNRVWAYLFGEGLVPSVDNFGRLGQKPNHPELLDHLAGWFVENGYSLKKLIAYVAKTRSYQMGSSSSVKAMAVDPANVQLSHFSVRRLDAEAIRDSVLAVSGRLDAGMYGESVPGTAPRRSIYIRAPRNNRDEFLKTFDAPEPLSTCGKRDITNVPAQSLALLNDPFVKSSAKALGNQLAAENGPFEERFGRLISSALGRAVSAVEIRAAGAMRTNMLIRGQELANSRAVLSRRLKLFGNEIESISGPIRKEILARRSRGSKDVVPGPEPYLLWKFENDANESLTGLKGKLVGNARIADGALVVDGGSSYVISDRLVRGLTEKTLEAWVQLDDLNQRGGGVISIQTPDGTHFDAIVFGERNPKKWMAGSNGFIRTRPFGGGEDAEVENAPVHVAIVYGKDGQITGYRNGLPYGKPYQSNGPRKYNAQSTVVAFGLRHLQAGGNRMLRGRILEARLYDRALAPDEVAASAGQISEFVAERELVAAMTEYSKTRYQLLKKQVRKLQSELEGMDAVPMPDENTVWAELAHAVFNLKEFIYLR
jgi:hypothetical protein